MTKTIAILGAGRVGSSLARVAVSAGYKVNVAGSGSVDKIALTAEILMPGATPMTTANAVAEADIVILAIPLHKYTEIDPHLLEGKIVIDTMNHWPPTNGAMDELDNDPRSTSEIIAEFFSGARIVKTLNHIGYQEIEQDAIRDTGEPRRALAFASDDAEAGAVVAELLKNFGFSPVALGALAQGHILEPGQDAFGVWFTEAELKALAEKNFSLSAGH